ncbi:hypothetical protein [Promicromonospora sukumoe]|uniref:hypothetical protein n=1 Tax=Promicromonospora sukumoe TaxID=88382 RepID=UPI0036468675
MSDIAIQTYLYDAHGSEKFHPVQELVSFTQKKYGYIEGFISLTIDGAEMFGPELWDDVGLLWRWLTIMLDDCRENGAAESSLVERAIPIRLEGIRGWAGSLLLTVGRPEDDHYGVEMRRTSVSAADLYPAVAQAYLDAFTHFRRLETPGDTGRVSEAKEARLRSWIETPRDSWLRIFPG